MARSQSSSSLYSQTLAHHYQNSNRHTFAPEINTHVKTSLKELFSTCLQGSSLAVIGATRAFALRTRASKLTHSSRINKTAAVTSETKHQIWQFAF
eukprot:4162377-Amphidinium_carterae.1